MKEAKKKSTPLSDLGEFGLIRQLTENIKIRNSSTISGVGDDAAVLNYNSKQVVVTNDLLVEGIHFNLIYTPLKHLGYKAVIVNLSDIFAMNATPRQILVSIAVSAKFSVEMVEELYAGIHLACEKYQVDLVGGDTSSSLTGLLISITALGDADEDEIVYRKGAREKDLICVSGDLGGAYMGLQLLEREKEVFRVNPGMQPDLEGYDYILERQLKPEARGDIVRLLKDMHLKPTAMIDVSDGLSSELIHICESSGKGCKIYEEKIPVDVQTASMAGEFSIDPMTCALNGGEDYELLFTLPLDSYNKIKALQGISVIGHITAPDEGKSLVTKDGREIQITAQGWNGMTE